MGVVSKTGSVLMVCDTTSYTTMMCATHCVGSYDQSFNWSEHYILVEALWRLLMNVPMLDVHVIIWQCALPWDGVAVNRLMPASR